MPEISKKCWICRRTKEELMEHLADSLDRGEEDFFLTIPERANVDKYHHPLENNLLQPKKTIEICHICWTFYYVGIKSYLNLALEDEPEEIFIKVMKRGLKEILEDITEIQ